MFLVKTTDPFVLVWFGKYVFKLFNILTEPNIMLYWQNSVIVLNCCDETLRTVSYDKHDHKMHGSSHIIW